MLQRLIVLYWQITGVLRRFVSWCEAARVQLQVPLRDGLSWLPRLGCCFLLLLLLLFSCSCLCDCSQLWCCQGLVTIQSRSSHTRIRFSCAVTPVHSSFAQQVSRFPSA